MKKHFSKFSALFAAAALMASCSSDEPAIKGGDTIPEGMKAYLNVSVMNVPDFGSRAGHEDGVTVNGSHEEHAVGAATFYFFDKNKKYVMKTTIQKFTGSENNDHGDLNKNEEFIGANQIVLEGLTGNTYPNYMLTVLNAPASFNPQIGQTIDEVRKTLSTIRVNDNESGNFVMSTSSYYSDAEGFVYGVNTLTDNDFNLVPAGQNAPTVAPGETASYVNVYVERLAAKVDVTIKATKVQKYGEDYYAIKVSTAGNNNDWTEGDASEGTTELYVKFDKWALNATTPKSYMVKNIDGFTANDPWANWSDATNHRSYWAKSVVYDQAINYTDAPYTLNYLDYAHAQNPYTQDVEGTTIAYADYCPENTNTTDKLFKDNVLIDPAATSVIFAAQLFEDNGEKMVALDAVRFNGVLFKKATFLAYALDYVINESNEFYYWSSSETAAPEDGMLTGETTNYFKGLDAAAYQLDFTKTAGTGMVLPISNLKEENGEVKTTITEGEGENATEKEVVVYVKTTTDAGATKYVKATTTEITALNNALKVWNQTEAASKANAYTEGKMFYTVAIQHKPTFAANALGKYGVVRNHWYEVNVDRVASIGHGVFNPGDGSETNPGEPLIPEDPKDPTYFIGATVNILSWKIVSQNVDL